MIVIRFPDDMFNIFFNFDSRHHYLAPAFHTAYFKIHAYTQYQKFLLPARMRLFQFENVAYLHVHKQFLREKRIKFIPITG